MSIPTNSQYQGFRSVLISEITKSSTDSEFGNIAYINIRAVPGYSETRFSGMTDDGALRVFIGAMAKQGMANQELIRFISQALDITEVDVEIV